MEKEREKRSGEVKNYQNRNGQKETGNSKTYGEGRYKKVERRNV
jgi:hypothetical protein